MYTEEEIVHFRGQNYCTKPFHSKTVLVKALPRQDRQERPESPAGHRDLASSGQQPFTKNAIRHCHKDDLSGLRQTRKGIQRDGDGDELSTMAALSV
ncbi:UNVERIFIED_CONTAM: hypothetical protein FKN15_012807 [Acipenser sinensis]